MSAQPEKPAENTPSLPETLPLFVMTGAILLPKAHLSLNIYEPNYLAMIDYALGHGRLIGIVQPSTNDEKIEVPPLYKVGCAARIMSFTETEDHRYLLDLEGLCRFAVGEESQQEAPFRQIQPLWQDFLNDMNNDGNFDFDRARLTTVMQNYFKTHGVMADWSAVQNSSSEELISTLSVICPLEPNEKQALLEAPTFNARLELLITLLEMASLRHNDGDTARH